MSLPFPKQSRKLGEILVKAGRISEFQLNSALSHQRVVGGRLGASLIKLGYLQEDELLHFLAEQLGLAKIDLRQHTIPAEILATLPEVNARSMNVLPVGRQERHGTVFLQIAMSDPTNLNLIDQLQFISGSRVVPVLASDQEISSAIVVQYSAGIHLDDRTPPFQTISTPAPGLPHSVVKLSPEEKLQALLKVLHDKGVLSQLEWERLR